jgi:D-serine deaminase-like pyridoxal phosphate-dependent protein
MTRPPADVGTPVEEIDTPALVIDLDPYERNLDRMARALAGTPVRLRGHAKTHKCPVVALHQIARGAVGACCQKVSEAEAMLYGGVRNVLVSNQIVGARKIARLVGLAKQAPPGDVAVCVDDPANARDLDEAARAVGVRLPVLVEINIGMNRCGVEPGEPALALARHVAAQRGLRFAGLQAYHGRAQHIVELSKRRETMEVAIGHVRTTVDLLKRHGLGCETVSGAGTGTYQFEVESGVYTEIQAGSYPFMDADYKRVQGFPSEFENALFVLATVMSRAAPDRAVVDAGLKALAVDSGLPVVRGRSDIEVQRVSDEHGLLRLGDPALPLRIGDRLWLIPGHCDPTINLYDWYVAVRGGRVEALWPITARGAVL